MYFVCSLQKETNSTLKYLCIPMLLRVKKRLNTECFHHTQICNVSSAWKDQISSSDSVTAQLRTLAGWVINRSAVITRTCISWLSEGDPAHTFPHSLTQKIIPLFLAQLSPHFQHRLKRKRSKYYWAQSVCHKHDTWIVQQTKVRKVSLAT